MDDRKIVVIDDCSFMLKLAEDVISSAGYKAVTAKTSIEANAHIFTSPFPLMILLDIEMPFLSGDKTARRLKDNEVIGKIPVVLMSGKTDEQLQSLCDESGADGYIAKPLTVEKFQQAVRQHCL
jgi:CheY-like chemotaxis protein